jgi:hypothetical protein
MSISARGLAAALAIALVSGCAGTNFKRPDPQALVVGKSTAADVSRVMGPPQQTGEALQNEQKTRSVRYAYAEGAGEGRYPGVVPARAMVFTTFNDLLVGQEFISSFKADATEFDESKVSSIVKGKTTRAEVVAMLGRPNGEAVYPVIKDKNLRAAVYSYSQAKGSVFNMKFHSKMLLVSYTPADVVADLQYTASGEK